jgi:hypothetical protein
MEKSIAEENVTHLNKFKCILEGTCITQHQRRNEDLPEMQRAPQCGSLLFKIDPIIAKIAHFQTAIALRFYGVN